MKSLALLISMLVLFAAAGCRTKGPTFDAYSARMDVGPGGTPFSSVTLTNGFSAALRKPPTEPYRLGPGDSIEIETLGDANSRTTVTIGPDGKIYYSLLPATSVWGLSLAETRALLQKEMAKYTRAVPELVINLRGAASQRVWLLGVNPGVYPLSTPMTLLDALAASGGVPVAGKDDVADLSRSFVLRNGRFLPVDFEALLKRGDFTQNIYLAPDDFVFVRPVEVASVYVLGAVNGPNILPHSRDLTVAEAIMKCGGVAKYAQQSRVAILRGRLTQPKMAVVDYRAIVTGKARNLRLEPGDIVYVSYLPFRQVLELAEQVLNQFVRTVAINEGSALGGVHQPVGVSQPFGIITQ